MYPVPRSSMVVVLLMLVFTLVLPAYPDGGLPTLITLVSPHTRLLVVAPHPDDEILGAGGLIQRVLRVGGAVQVVFMTNGDGFPAGVGLVQHTAHPTAQDYRTYGRLRQTEARQALAALGVPAKAVTFLGFPDGGLCPIRTQYSVDTDRDYTSPFTLANRPPSADVLVPNIEYNGEDLHRELAWVLHRFRPSLVVTTHPRDQHPDHCSTYFFVQQALADLQQRDALFRPAFFTFLVHFGGWWPVTKEEGLTSPLFPPQEFPEPPPAWLSLALSAGEIRAKRQALLQYHSQMLAMGQYLLSFVRTNELFVRASLDEDTLPAPCCHH